MMKTRNVTAICVCFTLMLTLAHSYSLTVIVAQNDKVQNDIRLTTRAVEDALMNKFFDGGAIVSNEPIIADASDQDLLQKEIRSAVAGGFDYVLRMTVEYRPQDSVNPAGIIIADIQSFGWELLRSSDAKLVARGTFVPPTNLAHAQGLKESDQAIKKMCEIMHKDINTAIAGIGRL